MSQKPSLNTLLDTAQEQEKKYNWLEARDRYEQALDIVDEKDFLKRGELRERIGYCLHRAAFQAKSQEEFKERIGKAVEAYQEAQVSHERSASEEKSARINRCSAMAKYLAYWVERRPAEKLRLLDECLGMEAKALAAFWDLGNRLEYGRTYNEFPLVFLGRAALGWDLRALKRLLDEGIQWGEKAVGVLSELGRPDEVAKAHLILATCLQILPLCFVEDPGEQDRIRSEAEKMLNKGFELAEGSGDAHLSGMLRWRKGGGETGSQSALLNWEKVLEYGEEARDDFLRGAALSGLAATTSWRIAGTEDPDNIAKLGDDTKEFHDKADRFCSIVSCYDFVSVLGGPPWGQVNYHFFRGFFETDRDKKRGFYDKGVEIGTKALEAAEEYEIHFSSLLKFLSYLLYGQAQLESDLQKRKKALERALNYIERSIEREERRFPFDYWDNYVEISLAGLIKGQLADTEEDLDAKTKLLEDAARAMARGIELARRQPRPSLLRVHLALRETWYAKILERLYLLTNEPEHLKKAVEASQRAIESFTLVDQASRIAESYWEIAKTQGLLGEYLEASESFKDASRNYEKAAERIPQLKDFYRDYASYMEAWSEILKARQLHAERDYGGAAEHYRKAAELHRTTQRWEYLQQSYAAWAWLEEAEDLSRREETQDARDLFQRAAEGFAQARESIKTRLKRIDSQEEKQLAEELVKASDVRREYCLGRVSLEEAKLLDKQGDHAASSKKYGLAGRVFQRVAEAMDDESERREATAIVCLCRAWEKMTGAEAEGSPNLYLEASKLFEVARENSLDEKSKMLALGHSRFCRALEAGARYEDTRDPEMYSAARQHVETATNYYVRAGFKDASEYAKATNRLFEAYSYMYQGQLERDLAKRAQLYQLAEKLLQTSAGFYVTAKHPEKSDEVLRVLESVRQEREITMSLTEVLHAPAVTSTTASFSTPSQTREQAVGLERFENADIQANLIPRDQESRLGDVVRLKIDLVNAGRGGAQLIKVAELLPEGFEVVEMPETYLVEDHGLNLKGKNLAPLRTEELNLVLKPLDKGNFQIKPRILYLDESGKYKSHEPEPATIVVKELGISGWLKGPTREK